MEATQPGSSLFRLLGVLVTGMLLLGVVLGSIWLTQADALVGAQVYRNGYALPTPTLFPTRIYATPVPTSVQAATTSGTPSPTVEVPPSATGEAPVCELPPGWEPHVVEGGDTLYTLADQVGTNLQALLQGNCLDVVYELQAGEIVYLPVPVRPTAVPPPRCPGPPAAWRRVLVQPRETLYSLAIRYGTTVDAVRRANCMWGDLIKAGQYLYLPPVMVVPPTPLPTLTGTPTPAPTAMPPVVPTAAPTAVPTLTPTPMPTATPTVPLPTPPPTASPTETTPTATPSATPPPAPDPPTATPSATPTRPPDPPTATPTITPVPVDTAVPTPTWTPDPGPLPTQTDPASTPTSTSTPVTTAPETATSTTTP